MTLQQVTHPKITFSSPEKRSLSFALSSAQFFNLKHLLSCFLHYTQSLIKEDTHPFSNKTHPAKHSFSSLLRASYEIAHLSLHALNCPLKLTRASQIMFSFKSSVGYLSCVLVPPHPNPFLESYCAQINICSSNCSYVTDSESFSKAKPPYNKMKMWKWTEVPLSWPSHLYHGHHYI